MCERKGASIQYPVVKAVSLPDVRRGFRGVADETGLYRIQVKEAREPGALRVLDTGLYLPYQGGYATGHLDAYDTVLPPDCELSVIPTSAYVAEHPEFIRDLLLQTDVLRIHGGEHLGPGLVGSINAGEGAERFGGYNPLRDQVESLVLRAALMDERIFPYVTCRGMQLLTFLVAGIPPAQVQAHHRPPQEQREPVLHELAVVLPSTLRTRLRTPLPALNVINSYHEQGYTVGKLEPYSELLAKAGWHIAAIDGTSGLAPEDRVVELMLRVTDDGHGGLMISGLAVQGHPERQEGHDALLYCEFVKSMWEDWRLYKQE